MLAARLAIQRWGWLLAGLLALTAGLERELDSRQLAPIALQRPSAPAPTLFDHVPLRRVTLGSSSIACWPVTDDEPGVDHAPTLTVRGERPFYFGHTVGGLPELPAWLAPHYRGQAVLTFHAEPDGSWLAITGATVILIDREHHIEVGLDFHWFQVTDSSEVHRDGADILEAHRWGGRVIVRGVDPQFGSFLASVDIATGRTTWVVQVQDDSVSKFAVTHGYAVTSEFVHAHPALVVYELGGGCVVASVPTKDGWYSLETRPDGNVHGVVEALAADGFTSELDLDVDVTN